MQQACTGDLEELVKELNHSFKNELQIIASLLSLQSSSSKNEEYLGLVSETKRRIKAISFVHDKLELNGVAPQMNVSAYLKSLVGELCMTYQLSPKQASLKLEAFDVWIGIQRAVPLALIVSELCSSGFQHSLTRDTSVSVLLHLANDTSTHQASLKIHGTGFSLLDKFEETLSGRLVNSLCAQMEARFSREETGRGGCCLLFTANTDTAKVC